MKNQICHRGLPACAGRHRDTEKDQIISFKKQSVLVLCLSAQAGLGLSVAASFFAFACPSPAKRGARGQRSARGQVLEDFRRPGCVDGLRGERRRSLRRDSPDPERHLPGGIHGRNHAQRPDAGGHARGQRGCRHNRRRGQRHTLGQRFATDVHWRAGHNFERQRRNTRGHRLAADVHRQRPGDALARRRNLCQFNCFFHTQWNELDLDRSSARNQ